ncbi:uncharacterized protein [Dysidea avara]|uniref:uncharacterized protein isoform X2 n=1 Tax=Dysidea avara TaxID=196820 RepID=UPI003316760F
MLWKRNIMVQYKGSPYYMQVENQSGNTRGRIIVVEKVEDPGNVNVCFRVTQRVQDKDQTYATLENSSIEKNMVVGVHSISEPLVLLNKQKEDSLNQWMIGYKKSSNAYFSLSKTCKGVTYYAMPSVRADGKISLILKKNNDSIEHHIFSWPPPTPVTNFISLTGCTKETHQAHMMVQENDSLRYVCANDHDYVVTTTDPSSANVMLSWKNLAQKEGYFIRLGSNSRLLGVKRIGDGEALELQKSGDEEFNTKLKVEFYKDNAASEHFSLCFISPINGKSYYVTPSPIGEPLRIYSNPEVDVHVFKVGKIATCSNGGVCVFKRLMKM